MLCVFCGFEVILESKFIEDCFIVGGKLKICLSVYCFC